jgi:hypothetical protein
MAYYDRAAAEQEKRKEENFNKLMERLSFHGDLSEHWEAGEYIKEMQNKIKDQDERLSEFYKFFNTLSRFLPRQSSIHDVIG